MERLKEQKELIKEFYVCPKCGAAICGEKRKYFICPECGRALCEERDMETFSDKYCGNCGTKITNAKETALALVRKKGEKSGY